MSKKEVKEILDKKETTTTLGLGIYKRGHTDEMIVDSLLKNITEIPESLLAVARRSKIAPETVKKWLRIFVLVQSSPAIKFLNTTEKVVGGRPSYRVYYEPRPGRK